MKNRSILYVFLFMMMGYYSLPVFGMEEELFEEPVEETTETLPKQSWLSRLRGSIAKKVRKSTISNVASQALRFGGVAAATGALMTILTKTLNLDEDSAKAFIPLLGGFAGIVGILTWITKNQGVSVDSITKVVVQRAEIANSEKPVQLFGDDNSKDLFNKQIRTVVKLLKTGLEKNNLSKASQNTTLFAFLYPNEETAHELKVIVSKSNSDYAAAFELDSDSIVKAKSISNSESIKSVIQQVMDVIDKKSNEIRAEACKATCPTVTETRD